VHKKYRAEKNMKHGFPHTLVKYNIQQINTLISCVCTQFSSTNIQQRLYTTTIKLLTLIRIPSKSNLVNHSKPPQILNPQIYVQHKKIIQTHLKWTLNQKSNQNIIPTNAVDAVAEETQMSSRPSNLLAVLLVPILLQTKSYG